MEPNRQFVLPVSVVSPTDIARLLREIDNIDNFFRQAEIRSGGQPTGQMPQVSFQQQGFRNLELKISRHNIGNDCK